mmetsp:Transcript_5902/g.14528  ORF Transcript_5902/g.14528 Transcript_5902/m.14528 type:complete len:493 (-) Transcript_5902:134-1612(-)
MRLDDVVDEAARAGHEGVGEAGLVLGLAFGELGRVLLLLAKDDLHRALGAHHRDLGIRPCEVHVAAQVLGGHHVVGAAVGFAGDDGDLGHRGLGVGVEQLGTVLDDAAVLLAGAGHEAGHIDEGDDRDVEGVAKAHEARGLDAALDVQAAGQHQGLVGDDADRLAFHAREAGDDVLRVVGLQLEEVAVVHDLQDQLLDVIGLVGILGDEGVERVIQPVGRVTARAHRRLLAVGQRQVVEEAAQHQQRLDVVLEGQVGHAALGVVGGGAAQFLGGHLLVGHGLHHLGAGDEHVAAVLHHEDEVGHGRRIHRTAGAGPHDQADLRDDAGGQHVLLEHVGIAPEARHALLDARAARVVQADDRGADLHGLVHHLADLLGMGLAERTAEDGEVLAEGEGQAAVDHAVAGHDAVAGDLVVGHAEVDAAVLDEHVPLLEAAFVEQQLQPLAGGQLALGMLGGDALLATAEPRQGALGFKCLQDVLHGAGPRREFRTGN